MNIIDIITKKKNCGTLSKEELDYAFNGYLNKKIPDYQMSALLMAVVINGMNFEETINLTDLFIKSGETYNLCDSINNVVDKHSTGGVGDTTTLIIGPMCAALGLHMAKMSGRGLGLTGGTIDKVESIPGFNVNLDKEKFINQVHDFGFALSSQTDNLTPLDKVIYSLRDVTGTTESIPLIASSIMSKKIALGAEVILIDVKVGSGALIKNNDDAKKLSDWLIKIGEHYNKKVKTIISNMSTPLSSAIGNALEVEEAINVLKGKKCLLYNTCIEIVTNLYSLSKNIAYSDAERSAIEVIESGKALEYFYKFVELQGGRINEIKIAPNKIKITANKKGIIEFIDALGVAKLAAKVGASKMTLDDKIDYSVGVKMYVEENQQVNKNDLLFEIYLNDTSIKFDNEDFMFFNIK